MSEQYPDRVEEQEKRENYLYDAILDAFLELYPRRTIELTLSIGLSEISLEQPGKKSDLCITEAMILNESGMDDFFKDFKSYILEIIELHKVSKLKRGKPRIPKFSEGELSKKYNEEKISNFMKYTFAKNEQFERWWEIMLSCDDRENENGEFFNTCGFSGLSCLPGTCPYRSDVKKIIKIKRRKKEIE